MSLQTLMNLLLAFSFTCSKSQLKEIRRKYHDLRSEYKKMEDKIESKKFEAELADMKAKLNAQQQANQEQLRQQIEAQQQREGKKRSPLVGTFFHTHYLLIYLKTLTFIVILLCI